jgi:hypothetical protein
MRLQIASSAACLIAMIGASGCGDSASDGHAGSESGTSNSGSSGSGSGASGVNAGPSGSSASGTSGSGTSGSTGSGTGASGSSASGTTGSSAGGTTGSTAGGTTGSSAGGTGSNTGSSTGSTSGGSGVDAGDAGPGEETEGDGGACNPTFASGVNVAWFTFAGDVPSPNMTSFDGLYSSIYPVGGRVVRWWFHTDGMTTPGYDSTGLAKPISASNIADVKKILDAAAAAGESVNISLWSFGMLDSTQASDATVLANNKLLLTTTANRNAYVTNVLTPLVTALKGHPGIYSWEIFNEPEGMIDDGPNPSGPWQSGGASVGIKDIQTTINVFGSAIHNADPSAKVTNGAWTFIAIGGEHGQSGTNYYSDAALKAAGGMANGTLDYYEVHYYDNWGTVGQADPVSPFIYTASSWNLDKAILVGEFWAVASPELDGGTFAANSLYTTLYSNGYKGAWAWQYANSDSPGPASGASTKWPAMQAPMQALETAHAADLQCH